MHETVQNYYGKQLQSSADLKTDVCGKVTPFDTSTDRGDEASCC